MTIKGFNSNIARSESGSAKVEYSLLLALIAIVLIGGLTLIGYELTKLFYELGYSLQIEFGSTILPIGP